MEKPGRGKKPEGNDAATQPELLPVTKSDKPKPRPVEPVPVKEEEKPVPVSAESEYGTDEYGHPEPELPDWQR